VSNKTIGEICDILSGYAFDSKLFTDNPKDKPLIRIRDVLRGYTNTYTQESYDQKYIVKKGDLLIGMDGEFNIAPWKNGDALLNQRVCKIFCTSNQVIEKYLLYFMPKALEDIERETSYVTVKHLSVKTIKEIKLYLPSLDQQKQIAKTLDTVAELLVLRKQQLVELDNLIKSTFYDMFGDPVTNEKGWDYCLVGKTIKVLEAGWSADGVKRKKENDEKAVLKVSAVTSGDFQETECKVLDKSLNIKKYVFPHKHDLLFSRANTRELVGATCIIFDDYPNLLLPDKLWRIEFNSITNFIYMKYILSDDSVRNNLSNISTGTSGSMYNVSMDKLKSMSIPLPPRDIQNQFAAIVTKIEEQKALVKKAIDETQNLFDSLMSEYFE
jgi:type I restriction enzyme S subunit